MNAYTEKAQAAEREAALNVVVAYDELRSGKHAKELCDRLAQRLGSNGPLHLTLWSLAALQMPQVLHSAAKNAARAALILIAADGQKDLTPWAKAWVTLFSAWRTGADGALAVLLHGPPRLSDRVAPAGDFLKRMAHTAEMAFFSHVVAPEGDLPHASETRRHRAGVHTTLLKAMLQHG